MLESCGRNFRVKDAYHYAPRQAPRNGAVPESATGQIISPYNNCKGNLEERAVSAYVIGNVVGRLLISYALVLFVVLLFSRLDWRLSLQRSVKWYGLLMTTVVFLAGLSQAVIRGGGLG